MLKWEVIADIINIYLTGVQNKPKGFIVLHIGNHFPIPDTCTIFPVIVIDV